MYNHSEEQYLVGRVLSGNRKAVEQLVKQYEGLVLHIVTPLIGVNEDREDICQDVFLKVFEKLHTFGFRSKLSTWIGHIAYNASINFLQKKRNILLSELTGSQDDHVSQLVIVADDDPQLLMVEKEKLSCLRQAIDQLPPVQRTMILLFHYHDLSLEEISAITGDPVNTVKSHLFRARKNLKAKL
jgi:RNA polymerase sigma-70 factor (ECF subfamily)